MLLKIVDYIQGKSHSVDVLLAIHAISSNNGSVRWKDVKQWFKQQGKTISDSTFRDRRTELAEIGLVEKEPIDPLRFNTKMTPKGMKVAETIIDLITKLEEVEGDKT